MLSTMMNQRVVCVVIAATVGAVDPASAQDSFEPPRLPDGPAEPAGRVGFQDPHAAPATGRACREGSVGGGRSGRDRGPGGRA